MNAEQDNEVRYTVYVNTYGQKRKCVLDVGQRLARMLYLEFGPNFRIMDHRSQLIEYDPKRHDWGFGEL
jgi:hypothetical protein